MAGLVYIGYQVVKRLLDKIVGSSFVIGKIYSASFT
jgi:hypothetical protein